MKRRLSFRNLGIRYKLFSSYVLVIMVPFLILLFINIQTNRQESKDNALYLARKMLDETNSYLQYKSQAITEVLNFVAFNNLVQENVIADSTPYLDVNLWHMNALQLSRLVNQFRYNEDIETIQLYMKQGLAGATENPDFLSIRKLENEPWFQHFANENAVITWLPSSVLDGDADPQELSVIRKIPNSHNLQQFDGLVRARVTKSGIQNVLDHAVLTQNTFSLLFNKRGEVLSASKHFPLTSEQSDAIINKYKSSPNANDWNDRYSIGGQRYLLGVQEIPRTDMVVAMIVPYSDILASSNKARNRTIWIFLLIVPLMLPLSYLVTNRATKRILRLIAHIRMVKNGRFPLAHLPVSEDEIGELTRNFNEMANNISNLMDETFLLGREVKNKELQALQAQINPHFLYNTLDLINVMAIESGASDISRVVDELAVFYKLSLSSGKEYVTLGNELKHMEAYVRIQNMRFGGGIRLQMEVSRNLYDYRVPKILLQPLAENAILHGIMEKEPEEGAICISSWLEDGDLLIEVADDGVGMDAEQMNHIFKERSSGSKGGGYGVRNIQERLRIAYGAVYGLKFQSEPGKGTRVLIRLPAQIEA